jgi:hypothetical protein
MPSDIDDLVLTMRHLEAAAHASRRARALAEGTGRLRTELQRLAAQAQADLSDAERDQADAAEKMARARTPDLAPLEAADLLGAGRALLSDAKVRAVKARARLGFALAKMDEVERREWEALHAEALADAHTQLADAHHQLADAHTERAAGGDAQPPDPDGKGSA